MGVSNVSRMSWALIENTHLKVVTSTLRTPNLKMFSGAIHSQTPSEGSRKLIMRCFSPRVCNNLAHTCASYYNRQTSLQLVMSEHCGQPDSITPTSGITFGRALLIALGLLVCKSSVESAGM